MLSRHPDSVELLKRNRRCDKDRRAASDRRNLIRFEDLGNERRVGLQRRNAGFYWEMGVYPETDL